VAPQPDSDTVRLQRLHSHTPRPAIGGQDAAVMLLLSF